MTVDQRLGNLNFFAVSKNIARDFIHSVVAVDDRMVFESRLLPDEAEILEDPEENNSGIGYAAATQESIIIRNSDDQHKLYYQDLSSAFAEKGIICSGFKPSQDVAQTKKSIVSSSKSSDITILDWQMDNGGNKGSLAVSAILDILKLDINEGGRLRLIIVYTAENQQEVLVSLHSAITASGEVCKNNNSNIIFNNPLLKFCKLEVMSKSHSEKELSEEAIDSFTKLTAGLLSNAAISAITDIRNKTHNILYKFNKNLDPAYLSHVLGLISSPGMREQAHEVAFDYAVELISEEIKSELQISESVKKSLSFDTLSIWPDHINDLNANGFFGLTIGKLDEVRFGNERMKKFLTIRTDDDLKGALNEEPKIANTLNEEAIKIFEKQAVQLSSTNNSAAEHLELSALECVRRDVGTIKSHIPVLKQGTIIKSNNEFFICIQPLCDSVRLVSNTGFTFLRISKVKSGKPFSHVLRSRDGHIRLCIDPCSKRLNVFSFYPCAELRVVKTIKNADGYFFTEAISNKQFEWCGELKQPVSQAIANSVAAQLCRVGVDSFEWLRLKAKS